MARILIAIALAGGAGGLLNSLVSGIDLSLPRIDGPAFKPGTLGTIIVGALAAFVSFGLYGPLAAIPVIAPRRVAGSPAPAPAGLALASLVGAVLVGFSGGRWLTSEVDLKINQATAESSVAALHLAVNSTPTSSSESATVPVPDAIKIDVAKLHNDIKVQPAEKSFLEAKHVMEALSERMSEKASADK